MDLAHLAPLKGRCQEQSDSDQVVAEFAPMPSNVITCPNVSEQASSSDVRNRGENTWRATIILLRPAIKRSMDIIGSVFLLIFLFPLLTTIACAVALDGGSVIYASMRVGRDGQEFRLYKFRTMVPDAAQRLSELLRVDGEARAEWERTCKLNHDPRVTRIGRALRRLSLDELPQFFNVLVGSMSLVGPRPVPRPELEMYYGCHAQDYMSVRPGLTGPWQVGGRSDTSYDRRVAFDIAYARNPSIRTDLRTLWETVAAVLFCRGAR